MRWDEPGYAKASTSTEDPLDRSIRKTLMKKELCSVN